MIYIMLYGISEMPVALNIEAIGYFEPYDGGLDGAQTRIYITGGTGGELLVKDTPQQITDKLKELGCEFG